MCVCYKSNHFICWNHSLSKCFWSGNGDYLKLYFLLKVDCYIECEEGSQAKLIKIVVDECRHLLLTVKLTPRTSPLVYSNNNHGYDFPDYWDDTFFVAL